jgi:hypothetical protein
MKRFLAILRYFFVSPEFLVVLAGLALANYFPNLFVWLSGRIGQEAEVLKYFGFLPALLVAFNLKLIKNFLFPDADDKKALQNWNQYWNIKTGCAVGLLFSCLLAATGIMALLFDWKSPAAYQSAILITSVVSALTVSATLFHAHIIVEEHFRRCKSAP